jgi:thioesterase domain-containing protein
VRIFARIEKQFGVVLPLATLFERPTIEYLAERIRARQRVAVAPARPLPAMAADAAVAPARADEGPFEFLVPIQTGGTHPALFCVHGAGGHVFNFSALARYLGADHPLYGFQARGVDGRATPMPQIEQMASAYLAELRRRQPQGPYFLSGYCGGGTIAFEMARRLRSAGQEVALLALIDCYRPGVQAPTPRLQRWGQGVRRGGAAYLLRKAGIWLRRNRDLLLQQLRIGAVRATGRTVPFELRDFWLTQRFLAAARDFRPSVYPGRLIILRATEVDADLLGIGPDLGWSGYAAGGIDSFDVPGDHYSLLQEPNIRVLGAALKDCLEAAERGAVA